MVYTPFDFNEAISQRREWAETGLREGSPVVGVSIEDGLFLLTVRQTQRKVFEIYDRLIYSAIGNQSDIEAIRIGAIDVAHREGFERSPDDVTAHRLLGFALSPPLKKLFGDSFNAPAVVRAIFGEMGPAPQDDLYYVLNYDGEFFQRERCAAVAGTPEAEEHIAKHLATIQPQVPLHEAIPLALRAWAVGVLLGNRHEPADGEEAPSPDDAVPEDQILQEIRRRLASGTLEVGLLDRRTRRESKFRLLGAEELQSIVKDFSSTA
ncbi:MAG: hypothetical protein ACP5VE_01930 [Chthonomonadales bacterium]